MKLRNIIIGSLLAGTVALSGCGSGITDVPDASTNEAADEKTVNITVSGAESESINSSTEDGNIGTDKAASVQEENKVTLPEANVSAAALKEVSEVSEQSGGLKLSDVWNSKDPGVIFAHDFTEEIKNDVAEASKSSSNLQDELSSVIKITERYDDLFKAAEAQLELNEAAAWTYDIWDAELNSLWKRFSDSADPATKERVLKDQRNWIAMKEEVTLENLGSREDGGSMYPLLEYSFLEEITKNRSYILASELAKLNGEAFNMPERGIYGTYVDNQGTGDVYSSLITRKGWENEDEAVISIYRLCGLDGTFSDTGNGELQFKSNDGNVEGIIHLNGWEGASFEVTKSGESVLNVGDKFDFGFAF